MRWTEKSEPKLGDKRFQTRFLLFPKTIDIETRWLEIAQWEEEYTKDNLNGGTRWRLAKWISQ
jgi:hypothetical protein